MPPARVGGISPDTGMRGDPVQAALQQAMLFNAAMAGLDQNDTLRLLGKPGVLNELTHAMSDYLKDPGYESADQVKEPTLRAAADHPTQAWLFEPGEETPPPADSKG